VKPAPVERELPEAFRRRNGVDGAWLGALPGLLDDLARRWSLTVGPPFPGIEYNYVAPAERAGGVPCVLKVSRYVGETANEIAALRLWDGDGAARLLEADPDAGALLLERLRPGTMLAEVAAGDDRAATVIAAGVLGRLWRPLPAGPADSAGPGLRPLESWCAAYDRNREALRRGDGGFPAGLFQRADAMRRDLLASTPVPVALHGDMHHFNVLRAGREPWLAIDPKGLAGDPCFDVCQFLRNPEPVPLSVNRERLDVFCAELGLDRARTRDWCFVHAVLDACWAFEDGEPWQETVAYAEETLRF
jgi:streptomycin 6-kinase